MSSSDDVKVILGKLRDAVAETQAAHYEKGWTAGQPLTIGEYESEEFKRHWGALNARVENAVARINRHFTALIECVEDMR